MDDRNSNPDLILRGGRVTTLDRANPLATAVAISKGKFVAVGSDNESVGDIKPVLGHEPPGELADKTPVGAQGAGDSISRVRGPSPTNHR